MSTTFAGPEGLTRSQPSSFTSRYYTRKEESDRCLMMAAGLGLAVVGLANRSLLGTFLAMAGGYLAYQSADCSHRWTEVDNVGGPAEEQHPHLEDSIDEAGAESFPASDPPAF